MLEDSTFNKGLWEEDLAVLTSSHRRLALRVFDHAVGVLGSSAFQRHSSRTSRSDRQTIFRTRLHRSFWLVIDTRMANVRLYFPDKMDQVHGGPGLPANRCAGTQWTRKREKQIAVPEDCDGLDLSNLIETTERIHDAAVDWYGRQKDSSETLRALMGAPTPRGEGLRVPAADEFARILNTSAMCFVCGSSQLLSLCEEQGLWRVACDAHHPSRSPWREIGQEAMPFEARKAVWHRDGGRCVQCGATAYLTFDHVIPANRGGGNFSGSNCETNLRLKCRTCNSSKSNKLLP